MAKGAAWMVLFKLIERGLGLISTIILARLLIPDDFGLIAMAISIIATLEMLNSFSFDMALIQNPDANRNHYDTAWTFNVILATTSSLILLLLAAPAAVFYDEPRLEMVIYFLAVGAFIQGLQNIGIVHFRKELEFNKEFKFLLAKKLVSFCVTVPLAFILGNYWALVIGMLTGKSVGTIYSYLIHPYRPRFSLTARHELFHFSKWLLVNNLLSFLRFRSAHFIIGKTSGTHSLGLYTIAYEISNLPTTELIAPINRAVFPGYAKMSSELAILHQSFLNIIAIITVFSLPTGTGIAAVAPQLVQVVLGEKWMAAVPLIQILAFFGVITALQTNTAYVYIALGKPKVIALLSGLHVLLLIPLLFWLTIPDGATGAAWAYLVSALVMLPVTFIFIMRQLDIKLFHLLSIFWRPITATLAMFLIVNQTIEYLSFMPDTFRIYLQLALGVVSGAVSYCVILLALWFVSSRPAGAEQLLISKLQSKIPAFAWLIK